MKVTLVTIEPLEPSFPRTMAEYHAKVKADNAYYYSKDAIAFRMWTKMCIWLKNEPPDNLAKMIMFCLDAEERDRASGAPINLRQETIP